MTNDQELDVVMDHRGVFVQRIQPLMNSVTDICAEYGVPFAAAFQTSMRTVKGDPNDCHMSFGVYANAEHKPEDIHPELHSMLDSAMRLHKSRSR